MLRHCRCLNIETRHPSQCDERRCITGCPCAGQLAALIDTIPCQVRFIVGIPQQRGAPCRTRPQHQNASDSSHSSHSNILIVFSQAVGTPHRRSPRCSCQATRVDYSTELINRRPSQEVKQTLFTVATVQGAYRYRSRSTRGKTQDIQDVEMAITGTMHGDCR